MRSCIVAPLLRRCLQGSEQIASLAGVDARIHCDPGSFIENLVLLTGYFEREESEFISLHSSPV